MHTICGVVQLTHLYSYQLKKQEEAVENVTLKVGFNPLLEGTVTPKASPRVIGSSF